MTSVISLKIKLKRYEKLEKCSKSFFKLLEAITYNNTDTQDLCGNIKNNLYFQSLATKPLKESFNLFTL